MFSTLKRLFLEERLTEIMLGRAVKKNWITEEEKQEIINSKFISQ